MCSEMSQRLQHYCDNGKSAVCQDTWLERLLSSALRGARDFLISKGLAFQCCAPGSLRNSKHIVVCVS